MEILLWLVPPVVVSLVAMAWVGWLGRAGRGEIDREEAARRMGTVLERESGVAGPTTARAVEGSSGVAVRRPPERQPHSEPEPLPGPEPGPRRKAPRRLAS